MGCSFKDIIWRYSENIEVWNHYTSREIICFLAGILLVEDCDDLLTGDWKICAVFDIACGSDYDMLKRRNSGVGLIVWLRNLGIIRYY